MPSTKVDGYNAQNRKTRCAGFLPNRRRFLTDAAMPSTKVDGYNAQNRKTRCAGFLPNRRRIYPMPTAAAHAHPPACLALARDGDA